MKGVFGSGLAWGARSLRRHRARGRAGGFSVYPSVKEQARGHSATASLLAHHDPPAPHALLLMAQELLCYRSTEDGYDT